jgi:UDPglucose 6-dehydrogenase
VSIARKLVRTGAQVVVYDPQGRENAVRELPDAEHADTMAAAVRDADLVCVLTEWEEFRYADPHALGQLAKGKRVIDGRNCLDQPLWTAAGWEFRVAPQPRLSALFDLDRRVVAAGSDPAQCQL